jgi:hypothetical protein
MLKKVDPPKGMLEYATTHSPWYVTIWEQGKESLPYRVIAVYQEARQVTLQVGPNSMHVRVGAERICNHFKDLTER